MFLLTCVVTLTLLYALAPCDKLGLPKISKEFREKLLNQFSMHFQLLVQTAILVSKVRREKFQFLVGFSLKLSSMN